MSMINLKDKLQCFDYSLILEIHNIRLADDVLGGIQRTMHLLNSSFWDSSTFSKLFQLHNLAK